VHSPCFVEVISRHEFRLIVHCVCEFILRQVPGGNEFECIIDVIRSGPCILDSGLSVICHADYAASCNVISSEYA
jgi:hypothetical protein